MTAAKYGSLPFDAQIAFFRKKLALPTRAWTDIWQAEHDHAFVVAGAHKMEIVEAFQSAVQKAIEDGTTIAAFRKDFDKIVADHGWSYNGGRGWRTRVIYATNLRTSHAAGRFAQLQKLEFWQYHHAFGVQDPRPEHQGWDGLILPKDDPFWQTHYPPNGWGCRCYVTGMSKARMQRKGLAPGASPKIEWQTKQVGTRGPNPRTVKVPKGISPGFAYAPGRDAWIHAHALPPMDAAPNFSGQARIPGRAARDLLPEPKTLSRDILLPPIQDKGQAEAVAGFLKSFGGDIGKPVVFTDVAGEAVAISEALFQDHLGGWKLDAARSRELNLLAMTIRDPDEVWAWQEWHKDDHQMETVRAYLARYTFGGKPRLGLVIMRHRAGWVGVTAHTSSSAGEFNAKVEKNRRGVRLFRRGS